MGFDLMPHRSVVVAVCLLLANIATAKYVSPSWKVPGIAAKDVPQMIIFTVRGLFSFPFWDLQMMSFHSSRIHTFVAA